MLQASAPAKIILFGEHAVVYGEPAIAIPVPDLRAVARIEPHQHPRQSFTIVSSEGRIVLERLPIEMSDNPLIRAVQRLVSHFKLDKLPNGELTIESSIPIASGLGSGAAVSTAVLRVLADYFQIKVNAATLNEWVYELETLHHGTPSGIDNTVIVYEKPVYFIRNQPIESFEINTPIHLVIGDTGKRALTRDSVGDVRKMYEENPRGIGSIIQTIGEIAREAKHCLSVGDAFHLGTLMSRNHDFLRQLTVSSEELDRLVEAATQAGALGAKLSGGGRGGNMIALVAELTRDDVTKALVEHGAANVYTTTIGGH